MNWYEVLEAVTQHKGKIHDLSTGAPLLLPEVTNELVQEIGRLSLNSTIGKELGSYENLDGFPKLIKAFSERCTHDFKHQVTSEQVLVIPGVQAGLRYIQELIRERGQRILYPLNLEFPGAIDHLTPFPPSIGNYYSSSVGLDSCLPLFDIKSLNWRDVGAVILSRPHNPTGRLWSADEINTLATFALQNDAWIVLDETYALPFAPLVTNHYTSVDAPNIIHLYSFSKVGLAAERVGVVVAPSKIVTLLRDVLRRNIIQSPKLGQHLAFSAIKIFEKCPDLASLFGTTYYKRWNFCYSALRASGIHNAKIRIAKWEGGPFLWLEWQGNSTTDEVFRALLNAGVAVAPGSALRVTKEYEDRQGLEGLRIGLGASIEDLEVGMDIIARVLINLD